MVRMIGNPAARLRLSVVFLLASLSVTPAFAQPPVIQGRDGKLASPFARVYEKVAPAVVKIDVQTTVTRQQAVDPFQQFFGIPVPNQQKEQVQSGVGSGVIMSRDGHILTNNHVVAQAKTIEVVLTDNERYTAEVVGVDPATDLAVIKLKLDGKQLPVEYVAEIGDSDSLKPGDYAIAIGNPLGLDRTITVGVISALGRSDLRLSGNDTQYQNFIQTDAQINPGNSGGALCDINGRVIGINDLYAAQYAGIGFAIPVNMARVVMEKLIATGKVDRGFLGIGGRDIDKDTQTALDLPVAEGALVESIEPGTPAEKAGLKNGDVIVQLDGRKVKNYNDFRFRVAERNPGDTIKLGIIRNGERETISVILANRADYVNVSGRTVSPDSGDSAFRGIHVAGLNSDQYKRSIPDGVTDGVIVVEIDEDSPAARSDLQVGDIITEVYVGKARKVVKGIQDFEELKAQYKDSKKTMLVYRIQKLPNGKPMGGSVTVKGE